MRNDWSFPDNIKFQMDRKVPSVSADACTAVRDRLIDMIAREFKPFRFASEMLARAAGKSPRAAKNWLSGQNAPDAVALIELMASCSSIADEVERLVAERRAARETHTCRGSNCGGAGSGSDRTQGRLHPIV